MNGNASVIKQLRYPCLFYSLYVQISKNCLIGCHANSTGEGNCHPLQYSFLKNLMDRGTWWATVKGLQRVGHN